MIIELPESEDKALGFEITGKVTIEEEKKWVQKIEDSLRSHEKLNVLVVLNEGASWGINAVKKMTEIKPHHTQRSITLPTRM